MVLCIDKIIDTDLTVLSSMLSAPALASCLITSSFCCLDTPGAERERREEPPPGMRRNSVTEQLHL